MLFPEAEAMPIHDSSGEEEFIDDVPAATRTLLARHFQLMALAIELQRKADTWNTELCKEHSVCKDRLLAGNDLLFPKITNECPPSGDNKEACLRGLANSLYEFQVYLEYVEQHTLSRSAQGSVSIWSSTRHLADTLRLMMSRPDALTTPNTEAQQTLSAQLRAHTGWTVGVVKHLILENFTSFMEKTVRIIRFYGVKDKST